MLKDCCFVRMIFRRQFWECLQGYCLPVLDWVLFLRSLARLRFVLLGTWFHTLCANESPDRNRWRRDYASLCCGDGGRRVPGTGAWEVFPCWRDALVSQGVHLRAIRAQLWRPF